ncbi:MAG TPA: hypothetical protein VK929_02680 [Longimicrobiales bacterium]|nr:hypothetical protein [Longimicrobiales bacterium]
MTSGWRWRGVLRLATLMVVLAAGMGPVPVEAQARRPVLNQADDPLLTQFRWREIGPIGQGGRVNDIAVVESDPRRFYVAFAGGGLFRTENNGITFEDVFGAYGTSSVGAVAVSRSNPDVVYVGTGEANNRQSSTYGDGVYRSSDGGRTFSHVGLRETLTIARIVVHPTDPDVVWVAAAGALFGGNPERGVYKSTDGGRNWRRVLYENEHAGATELIIDPSNPNTLFAALYQRQRTAWGFASGGPGSGIFRSDDGGETWQRVQGNGLPNGTMGRIAMDFARSNPDVIYAQIEVAPDREPRVAAAQNSSQQGGQQAPDPQFSGVWRSSDKGRTWTFMSNNNVRPMYFSILRVDPTNPDIVYTGGVQAYKSVDGGRTWQTLSGFGHVDHHAIWINPKDGNHVMLGNDGSVDVSHDQAATWESLRTWSVGQPYHASVDMQRPYNVCTGLQDNGSWCGPSGMRTGPILAQDWFRVGGGDGFYTAIDPTDPNIIYWESQNGNINRVSLRDGSGGSIRPRAPTNQNPTTNIVPAPPAGTQIRWNWNTPFMLSPHNPSVVYAGGNRLFKSYDRGETWVMSPDLTKQIDRMGRSIMGVRLNTPTCNRNTRGVPCILSRNDGISAYGTIVSVAESPIVPGILWVGTDDGNIQVSRDGGATWTEVGQNVPGGTKEYYVSRVEASHHDPATAYASVDGRRSADYRPYVYVTRDYGRTWQSIASDLPQFGNVNTVRQDPKNPGLLYAGTEFGFFISVDEGRSWKRFMNNLATVRVDDVLVHPRENDLVLATHGRGVAVMDDISPLQQLTPDVMAAAAHLFAPREAVLWKTDRRSSRSVTGAKNWTGQSAPAGTAISYHLRQPAGGDVRIVITDLVSGEVFRELSGPGTAGLHRVQWNLRGNSRQGPGGQTQQGPLAQPGTYRVALEIGGSQYSQMVRVLEDVWLQAR